MSEKELPPVPERLRSREALAAWSAERAAGWKRAADAYLAELKRRLDSPAAHEDYLQRHPDMRERLGEFDPNWPR